VAANSELGIFLTRFNIRFILFYFYYINRMKKKHPHSASKNRVSVNPNSNCSSQNHKVAQPKGSASARAHKIAQPKGSARAHKVAMANTRGGAPTDPTPTRVWSDLKQTRTKKVKNPEIGKSEEVSGPEGYLSPPEKRDPSGQLCVTMEQVLPFVTTNQLGKAKKCS
jgi:hypothetical protein